MKTSGLRKIVTILEMMMNDKRKNIGDLLLQYNLISEEDLKEALSIQKTSNKRIGEILVDLKKVSEDDIQYVISKQLNIPFIFLTDEMIDTDLIKRLPKDFLIENRILPLIETDEYLSIVTNDPFNNNALNYIKELFKKDVKVSACSSKDILEKFDKFISFEADKFNTILKNINERLINTPFYRLNFLLKDKMLHISAFGSNIFVDLETFNNQDITYRDILEFFRQNSKGGFYKYFKNEENFLLIIFPILELKDIDIISTYGIYPEKLPLFTDLNYVGDENIFTSPEIIRGYNYISFDKFVDDKCVINIIDNYKGYYHGKVLIPVVCSNCGGSKCEKCKHLGYIFEVKDGKN